MITVSATEFRARAAKILKEVAASGQTVTVTKRGKPIVRVEKIDTGAAPIELGRLRNSVEFLGDVVSPVFDEWETLDPRDDQRRRRR